MELMDVSLQAGFSLANPNPDHHLPNQKQPVRAGGLTGLVQCHCRASRGLWQNGVGKDHGLEPGHLGPGPWTLGH